jgi:hypothetical protein
MIMEIWYATEMQGCGRGILSFYCSEKGWICIIMHSLLREYLYGGWKEPLLEEIYRGGGGFGRSFLLLKLSHVKNLYSNEEV